MSPKGVVPYVAGFLLFLLGALLCVAAMVFALIMERREWLPVPLIAGTLFMLVSFHLLAAGLYRMLCHHYRTISGTDLPGDRPLRGRVLYLLGQIAMAMAVPLIIVFVGLAADPGNRRADEMLVLMLAVPISIVTILSVAAFLAGLGIMVWDMFHRHQEIVDNREAERRRRLDEQAEESLTEIVPEVQTVASMRQHVKENR